MLLLQDSPCAPPEVTVAPRWQGCDSQRFRPRRTLTQLGWPSRIDVGSMRHAVIGNTHSQLLLYGILEANNLALSMLEVAPTQIAFTSHNTFDSFHDH